MPRSSSNDSAKPAKPTRGEKKLRSKPASVKKGGAAKQFVLLIGDEGAILVFMEGAKVVRRLFAPTPQPSSSEAMVQLMQSNPSVPISILVDSIDQQFVRQSFPPVSSLSVNSLVKRRLDRDFRTEDIKGFLPINRDKTGRKEWNFLLISLTKTPILTEWIDLVIELPNELKGIYLSPIEATAYIATLHSALVQTPAKPWQLFVTHNKVSGFRQVVMHNGKLVFTRVTQAIDDAIAAVIAGNIEQEIINTIEYLRRLGFQDTATLEITVIAAGDVNEVIDLKRFNAAGTLALTPLDVSDALGFEQAALSADRFGDVVMAAAFLRTKKHVLKLSTVYSTALSKIYGIKRAVHGLTLLAIFALVAMSIQNVLARMENQSLTANSVASLNGTKAQLEVLNAKVGGLNKDLAYKSAVVNVYDAYLKDAQNPADFMEKLSTHLTPDQRLFSIEWDTGKVQKNPKNRATAKAATPLTVRAEFDLKGDYADFDALSTAALAFIATLTQAMPDYTITHAPFSWQKDTAKGVEISFNEKQGVNLKGTNNRITLTFTRNAEKAKSPSTNKAIP